MFQRVDMAIINMRGIILIIANEMIQKNGVALYRARPTQPARRIVCRHWQRLGKALLDKPPAVRIVIVTERQCPPAMQMLGQHHPRINVERPPFPRFPHEMAQ